LFFQVEVKFAVDHDPGVKGPQAGDDLLLTNGTNVVLHQVGSKRVTAGGNFPCAEMLSAKTCRSGMGLSKAVRVGVVDVEVVEELGPNGPMTVGHLGSFKNHCGSGRCLPRVTRKPSRVAGSKVFKWHAEGSVH
jgi:hypothetical protein